MPCSRMQAVKCFSAAVTGAGVAAGLMWGTVDAGVGVLDVLLVVPVDPPVVPVAAPVEVLAVPLAVVASAEPVVCLE
jgi:hypothetical protein